MDVKLFQRMNNPAKKSCPPKSVYCKLLILVLLILSSSVFSQINSPASFYGGKKQLKDFISREMVYPKNSLNNKIEGKVELSFIINPDSTTSNLNIIKSVSPEIDAEAVRIFEKTLWIPAIYLEKVIPSEYSLEIDFKIKKYKKYCKQRAYTEFIYPYKNIDTSNIIYNLDKLDVAPYPIFKDRLYSFNDFIKDNMKYPEQAFSRSISGTVTVSFVIENHGKISNIYIENFIGGGCTEEAIRLINLLQWMPGIKDSKAVRTKMSLDIGFSLKNKSENNRSIQEDNTI
ncbi:MAG: TonB family protein [Bacteroidales bacterium]|nr:TonB family protein [Bacteroidales bacterium]